MRNNGADWIAITTMQTGLIAIANVASLRIIASELWGNHWISTTPWGKYVLPYIQITVSTIIYLLVIPDTNSCVGGIFVLAPTCMSIQKWVTLWHVANMLPTFPAKLHVIAPAALPVSVALFSRNFHVILLLCFLWCLTVSDANSSLLVHGSSRIMDGFFPDLVQSR